MSRLLILAGTLVDGRGGEPVRDVAVEVEGESISRTKPIRALERSDREGAEVLDLTHMTVLPGLINAHEHLAYRRTHGSEHQLEGEPVEAQLLRAVRNALYSLLTGVTTVRDVGTKGNMDIHLKYAIAAGIVKGPRMFATGIPIAMTGGHAYTICHEVDGPDEVRKAARMQLKAGADWLKLMGTSGVGRDLSCPPELTVAEMSAATEEAHRARKRVCVHATSAEGIREAVEAGVDSVEHGSNLDEKTAEAMARRGVFLVSTLSTLRAYVDRGLQSGEAAWLVERCRLGLEGNASGVRVARAAGVPIACGTDTRGDMAVELQLLASEVGMTPMECVETATRRGAELLGISHLVGTVGAGMVADLAAVEGDPLSDLGAMANVRFTVKSGQVYSRAALELVMGDLPKGPWGNLRT